MLRERPDYVILLAGVNDIYQGRPPEAVEENLSSMYDDASAAAIVPVAATVLPYNAASARESEAIRDLNHMDRGDVRRAGDPLLRHPSRCPGPAGS